MTPVELQSKDHRDLLDIIDRLREQGISRFVDLPQIVVVGDQSSGKSSVLEAISKMSFPTKDNLCTRFATELILRRDRHEAIKISIVPGHERTQAEKDQLAAIRFDEEGLVDLADVVEKARKAMGICETKVFATDILRVELSGPTKPHLTMVDLPGIFRAGNRDQSVRDAQIVQNMVKAYMQRQRSIIVAVVSAKSDFALQEITEIARLVDPQGLRTLGLITKPDTLDTGSESEAFYYNLAKNKDVKFRLGWHVLKNRSFKTKAYTSTQRDQDEAKFFDTGIWKSMDRQLVGIKSLTPRLSAVLKEQILAQLPSMIDDINTGLRECKQQLKKLGVSRASIDDQRRYLLDISERFTDLIKAAVHGDYSDPFFESAMTEEGYSKRLRARTQQMLVDFVGSMSTGGQSEDSKRPDYLEKVKVLMQRNKGTELPGTFNPAIIAILFADTCRPWKKITMRVKHGILDAATELVTAIIHHVTADDTFDDVSEYIKSDMNKLADKLNAKIQEILKPHTSGHPITYNHYLTDNIQKLQNSRRQKKMETVVKEWSASQVTVFGATSQIQPQPQLQIQNQPQNMSQQQQQDPASGKKKPNQNHNNNSFGHYHASSQRDASLLKALQHKVQPDMEVFAAEWAVDATKAYYKVAKKTYIDNFSTLAVESCLMQELQHLFTPQMVQRMDVTQLARLAAEGELISEDRTRLTEKSVILQNALMNLRKLDKHKTAFIEHPADIDEEDEDDSAASALWKQAGVNAAFIDELIELDSDEDMSDEE